MATNAQLYNLRWGNLSVDLRTKVQASILKQANYILDGGTSNEAYYDARVEWAKRTFRNPEPATAIALSHVALNTDVQTAELNTPGSASDQLIDSIVAIKIPALVATS